MRMQRADGSYYYVDAPSPSRPPGPPPNVGSGISPPARYRPGPHNLDKPTRIPGFWYLATPYSKYSTGLESAFKLACWQTGLLIRAGVPVFSPIAHTHPIAMHCHMDPLDHGVWIPADLPMMHAARGLIVCNAEGWQDSYGVGLEITTFQDLGRPVIYMDPGVVPPELAS